jgi:hypothetical protein
MELFEGNNYRINIVGNDSSVILDSWSGQLTANVVTNNGTILLDIEKETFIGSILGQHSSVVLDNLNRAYYGNVFTQYNEIIVNSNNKTLHGNLHGSVVNVHDEIIVDAKTGKIAATIISGTLVTNTGEIAFDPEMHLFKGTFQGQVIDRFKTVVVDSDKKEFFGNFIGSVYDEDKHVIFDCVEKTIKNIDIYSKNIYSLDGLLLIHGESGEIRGDVYGGNIYDVNNQLMIDSLHKKIFCQLQGNVCDQKGVPLLNIDNKELVDVNVKGGYILSPFSDTLIDCNNSLLLCNVENNSVKTSTLSADVANVRRLNSNFIEADNILINARSSMDEGGNAITMISTTDDNESVGALAFIKVKNNFGAVSPGDKLTGLLFGGQVVDGTEGAYAPAVLLETEVDPNGTVVQALTDGIIPGKFTISVINNTGDKVTGISTDMNGHTTTIIKDLTVVGNTNAVPVNATIPAKWLEIIVNGETMFLPLYS